MFGGSQSQPPLGQSGQDQLIIPAKHGESGLTSSGPGTGAPPAFSALPGSDPPFSSGSGRPLMPLNLRTIAWVVVVFLIVSAASLPLIWTQIEPTYRAVAVVRVAPMIPRMVFRTDENSTIPFYRNYLNTQVSTILSPTVLQRVLDQPQVQQTHWYKNPPRTLSTMLGRPSPSQLERLTKTLQARPRRDTELIDVSLEGVSPHDTKLIVDTVVTKYKDYCDEQLKATDSERLELVRTEKEKLLREIKGLVETKFNLSNDLGTLGPEGLRSQMAIQLSSLESQYDQRQREYNLTIWEIEILTKAQEAVAANAEKDPDGQQEDDPAILFAADPEWRRLQLQLKQAQHELELAGQNLGEAHPKIQQLTATVDFAKENLRDREAQLSNQWPSQPPGAAQTKLAGVPLTLAGLKRLALRQERELELLQESITRQRQKVTEAGITAKQIAEQDQELNNKREVYETVRLRLQELEIEQAAESRKARVSVAAHAIAATTPYRDRRIILSMLALGGGLFLGLAAAYLRASLDPKIREQHDVPYMTRAPFLGQLPAISNIENGQLLTNPQLSEGLRMIRTALLERLAQADHKVVLVTGASSRAGKTSVAIGLGLSLAKLGKKVLLVEADLRRPVVARRLGLNNPIGLAGVLNSTCQDHQAITKDVRQHLDVLPAGDCILGVDADAELLGDGALSLCLSRWRKAYDYIILDSPPVLPVADARILAAQSDGAVMVLRSSHTRRADASQAYAYLSTAGARLLGTVLVGVAPNSGYYGYYAGYEPDPDRVPQTERALP